MKTCELCNSQIHQAFTGVRDQRVAGSLQESLVR